MDDIQRRLAEGRAALRARFGEAMARTPSLADPSPQGDGPRNRHGMPKEPPGQNVFTQKEWPVLEWGEQPVITAERWKLTVDGCCEQPLTVDWKALQALPQVDLDADFHCVTGWSILDVAFGGVRVEDVLALCRPAAEATHVMFHAYDGYSTNLPLEEALKPDVLLCHAIGGKPLTRERGAPVRVVTPQLYAWKGAKWVNRIELMPHDRRGYWEIRGYSNTGYPWRDDRMW
ncbi:MAG: molybdopterin-dependent oxidoreductase [Deltaproteobacteria bacterium]|nr:molybdopterin-dependent oxidoreductase [Deltaproteobacteria bacterium]